jgi:serine/threonine-protein kinase
LNATFSSRYEILSELGHGAMGIVYKAQDLVIGRTVALKTIAVGHAADHDEVIERLKREAKAAGGLDHPNIITIYDVGHDGDRVYLSMQFVEGSTLAELLAAKKLPGCSTLLGYADQICSALAFAHEQGVIHRDLKPSNLMLTPHGQIKVLDFGIAKQGDVSLTQSGMVVGTPSYMAPEQATGKEIDHRSDIFALGAVFYELFTGKKAFPAETVTAVLYEVVHQDPLPPIAANPLLPPGLDSIIRCALEKNPDLRFQSCTQMRDALRKETALLKAAASTSASRPQLASGKHRSIAGARPKRWMAAQIAILAFLILALAAAVVWPQRASMPRFMRLVNSVKQLSAKVRNASAAPSHAAPISTDPTGSAASGAATSPSTLPSTGALDASKDATKTDTTTKSDPAQGPTSGAVQPTSPQTAVVVAADHPAGSQPVANQGTDQHPTVTPGSQSATPTETVNVPGKDGKTDPVQTAGSASGDDPATDPSSASDPPVIRKRPVVPPAPTVVEGFTRKDIPDLLRKAQAAAGSGDYASARYEFDIVLKLDRQNAIAREGLRRAVAAAKEKL